MGLKVTPDDIRAKGLAWPIPGYNENSFSRDEKNRFDLDEAIESIQGSLKFWAGENQAAADMTASAVSWSDHDQFKQGRREAAGKVARYRETLRLLMEIRKAF